MPYRHVAGSALVTRAAGGLARRGLMIEGMATLRGVGILHRIVLLPLSEDGATIDHVLGAMNYRPLPTEEELTRLLIGRSDVTVDRLSGLLRHLKPDRLAGRPVFLWRTVARSTT